MNRIEPLYSALKCVMQASWWQIHSMSYRPLVFVSLKHAMQQQDCRVADQPGFWAVLGIDLENKV